MKKCSCCGIEKTETEFQKRAASNDGLTASCKLCLKARDAERDKSEARKQTKRAYQKTESGKQAHANAMQKYKERYPMKRAAHVITGNAIRDGLLQKPSICSKCDSSHKIEAHHSDYTKPLSVEWFCESCHKEWHRNNEAK